ncbi:MAG: cell division protein FtsA [Verrucomicrobiae bacterium]|nr:cell division protein FtsA [Verrucomicrobiae bacterium]
MFSRSHHVIVGLEIGTSKVCAVVGRLSAEGVLNVVGVGQHRSRGVRKGEIVDLETASEDIRKALVEAENMANLEVRSVFLGVTGAHICGFNNRGRVHLPHGEREITESDVQEVVRNARTLNLPAGRDVLHLIRQHFIVDGRSGVTKPVEMEGEQLELDVHVVHGMTSRLQLPIKAARSLQIDVEEVVFNGIASSLAVLSNQEKDLGALVIDLGAGVTEYAVYSERVVKHTGVIAVGGDHVTNDLAYGLKVPMSRAEALKIEHGSALMAPEVRGRTLRLPSETGLPDRTVNLEHLHRIMSLRLEETFQIIAEDLERTGLLDYLRAGVVLCGGGSRVPGIHRLAERVFGLPASTGRTRAISGLVATLDQPEFATGIGLVRFGSFHLGRTRRNTGLASRIARTLGGIFQTS